MAKGLPTINFHLETTQSSLSVLRTLLAEQLHADDRKQLDSLIDRATASLDAANVLLADIRQDLNAATDQL